MWWSASDTSFIGLYGCMPTTSTTGIRLNDYFMLFNEHDEGERQLPYAQTRTRVRASNVSCDTILTTLESI